MAVKPYLPPGRQLSRAKQFHFAQQLLTLLEAGLPLLNAIALLSRSDTKQQNHWLRSLHTLLAKGNSFSVCLRALGNQFPPEFINLIIVSERSGNLNLALRLISEQLEKQIELHQKIKQSLSLPLITLLTSLLLVGVMMLWVIPTFEEVFSHFQAELPAPTQILISISRAIKNYFLIFLMLIMLSTLCFWCAWDRLNGIQKYCDRLAFKIPVMGDLFRIAVLSQWCRSLGHLIQSGLPLLDALRTTAQSSNHWVSHDYSAELFKHLARGWSLGDALRKTDPQHLLFDIETLELLQIGSEARSLALMLQKRSAALSVRLNNQLNSLSQNLEPGLIILVGAMIGSLVITLYLPIFNLGHIV